MQPYLPAIDVQQARVMYRNGHMALEEVSFDIPGGSITALVGINGSGKSTLFKAIMGLVPLVSGSIRLFGYPVRAALKAGMVAYVPQSEEVDWNFPVLVEDVVMMGRYGKMNSFRRAKLADRQQVDMALERVGMAALRKRQIGELSGGQKKRTFLARALAQKGAIILLDEPFTGVDVATEEAIIHLLGELRDQGRGILVSTHNLGSVPEFCDRCVLLNRRVLASGKTSQVFTRQNLEKTFGGVLRHFVFEDGNQRAAGVGILTDDERPLVLVEGKPTARGPETDLLT